MNYFNHEQTASLSKLTDFMLAYNSHTNLTRITDPEDIVEKHYIDSILPLTLYNVPRGTSVLDVGSGAGFPGIPIKIFRPDLDVTLLDSAKKRTDYLKAAVREIGPAIGNSLAVVTARSEELAHSPEHRGKYGLVISRAVANLPALCEYCLPFAKAGGVFLAMKGAESEAETAKTALRLLGGEVEEIKGYALPRGDKRSLVVIRKTSETPPDYPRRRVNIAKNPL